MEIGNGVSNEKLGHCSIDEAELWALIIGLLQAWDKGCRILLVEVDSLTIYKWITKDDLGWKHVDIIYECKDWLRKPWSVDIDHVYRECNRVANFMAKNALTNTNKNIIQW